MVCSRALSVVMGVAICLLLGSRETLGGESERMAGVVSAKSGNVAGNKTQTKRLSEFFGESTLLIAGGDIGGNVLHLVPNALFVSSTNAAQIFLMSEGRFVPTTGMLHQGREMASATVLLDGRVLIAGGLQCTNGILGSSCKALDTAELFDPKTGRFSVAGRKSGGRMVTARAGHSATLITGCACPADGKVLLAGGSSGKLSTSLTGITSSVPSATAELYDPQQDRFVAIAARMNVARQGHVAVRLANGRVLLAGGDDKGFFVHSLSSAEIFDPVKMAFSLTGSMNVPRELARATVLAPEIVTGPLSGNVLITGGLVARRRLDGWTESSAELYDPESGRFRPVAGRMSSPRIYHSATLFRSGPLAGAVLVSGGLELRGDGTARGVRQRSVATADIFTPSLSDTGGFKATGSLNEARSGHAFLLLTGGPDDGEVLVAGGENCDGKNPSFCYVAGSPEDREARNPAVAAELYDPTTGEWSPLKANMPVPVCGGAYGAIQQ